MGLANTFPDCKSNIVQQEDATILILTSRMVLTPLITPFDRLRSVYKLGGTSHPPGVCPTAPPLLAPSYLHTS